MLRMQVEACLLRLDDLLRVLSADAPAGMAATRSVEWRGPAAVGVELIAEGSEFARAVLVDGVSAALSQYRSASMKLQATA
ncbi:hypothetical protein GCM10011490_17940 [Pseudoclavibacter endophyticus]|nr:hypothetical protein GCM10011490_17940 [Pseudoclavibacter endophyticus]